MYMPFSPGDTPINTYAPLFENTHAIYFRSLSTTSTEAMPPCKGICTTRGEPEDGSS